MAGTLQFDLVSPERRLASVAATEVQIPATEGDMTAMEGHVPTITTLRPGILRAHGPDGISAFAVTGGFAEITATGVTVLAERAIPVDDLNSSVIQGLVDEARQLAGMALPEDRDAAERLVHDMMALGTAAGH